MIRPTYSSTLTVAVVVASFLTETDAFSPSVVSKPKPARSSTVPVLFSSTSTDSTTKRKSQDAKDKAFLTEQFSTRGPPVFPSFVVEGRHPADFESDGGIMMTEQKDPKDKYVFDSKQAIVPAVSEEAARMIGSVVDHHLPPFYYFE